jgi:hypothetical protein
VSGVQLALNVDDIDATVVFYSQLFDAEPAKRRPGYANFILDEPALKLVPIENPGHGGSLNPARRRGRLDRGRSSRPAIRRTRNADPGAGGTTCCYALQDKIGSPARAASRGRSTPFSPTPASTLRARPASTATYTPPPHLASAAAATPTPPKRTIPRPPTRAARSEPLFPA